MKRYIKCQSSDAIFVEESEKQVRRMLEKNSDLRETTLEEIKAGSIVHDKYTYLSWTKGDFAGRVFKSSRARALPFIFSGKSRWASKEEVYEFNKKNWCAVHTFARSVYLNSGNWREATSQEIIKIKKWIGEISDVSKFDDSDLVYLKRIG